MRPPKISSIDLRTPRLRLRRYRVSDLGSFCSLMGDVDVTRYVAGGDLSEKQATELFHKVFDVYADCRFGVWAVQDVTSGAYAGHAELKPRSGEPGLELVYLLRRSAWGLGLGTELARALRDHAFADLGATSVIATIHPENDASRRVLLKLDFQFVREWKEPGDDVPTCLWAVGSST